MLQHLEPNQQTEKEREITLTLLSLFLLIFPMHSCNYEDLFGIVQEAVKLRNDITKERAVYSIYWFSTNSSLNLDTNFCEFEGWRDEQPLWLCVFPGLSESVKLSDGSIKDICIKPARVALD